MKTMTLIRLASVAVATVVVALLLVVPASATILVTDPPPPPPAQPPPIVVLDSVVITRAEFTAAQRELRLEAASTDGAAILTVWVTATNAFIGTLVGDGTGKYKTKYVMAVYPQTITVRSNLGGSYTGDVILKP